MSPKPWGPPPQRRKTRQATPSEAAATVFVIGTAVAIIVMAVAALALSGCKTIPVPPPRPCDTCIGPYDISLSSHRVAVFGEQAR